MNSTRRHRPWGPIFASEWYEYSFMPISTAKLRTNAYHQGCAEEACLVRLPDVQSERAEKGGLSLEQQPAIQQRLPRECELKVLR
jgi:hypothetical protein